MGFTNPLPGSDPPETPFAGRIVHPQGEGIIYGPGCAQSNLVAVLRKAGVRRPMLVTTSSVVRCGLADEVASWLEPLADGPVTVFSGSKEHTPSPVVLAAARMAQAEGVDGLVSLGGSSVVDLTKGIAMVVAEGEDLERLYLRLEPGTAGQRPVLAAPKLPHVALPTTLSGAEFTSAAGITDPPTGEKRIYIDSKLTPQWVLLDPDLCRSTPPQLWASTGMKVLSDAVEVFCSPRCNPLAEAAAGGALRLLIGSLEAATADPDDLDARTRCLFAVGMTLPQLTTVGLGLVAAPSPSDRRRRGSSARHRIDHRPAPRHAVEPQRGRGEPRSGRARSGSGRGQRAHRAHRIDDPGVGSTHPASRRRRPPGLVRIDCSACPQRPRAPHQRPAGFNGATGARGARRRLVTGVHPPPSRSHHSPEGGLWRRFGNNGPP